MANNEQSQAVCKSVFKSGENAISSERFTEKWIELINRVEKNKGATCVR